MPAPKVRSANKNDVALAEVHRKHDREVRMGTSLTRIATGAAVAIPVWALHYLVDPLAGQTTTVHVNIVVSLAIAFSATANGIQYLKIRSQRDELIRQRERLDALEAELGLRKELRP